MNRLYITIALLFYATSLFAQSRVAPRQQPTTGTKSLLRLEQDFANADLNQLTIDRITTSGAHIIWTYSSGETEKKY